MRVHHLLTGLTVLSITWMTTTASGQTARNVWRNDFVEAWDEAQQTQKPMLIHFYADWCGPCRQMDRTVLNSPEILKRLESSFVAVKVNSDEQPGLVKKFHVRVLPCDIFVDPNGHVISQTEGFQPKNRYHSKVARIGAQVEKTAKIRIAKENRSNDQVLSNSDGTEPAVADNQKHSPQTASAAVPGDTQLAVGLDGYSPVALGKTRKWIKGKKELSGIYQNFVYYLATAEELRTFQNDPGRFAPQLLGCDPVMLWKTDRAVMGDTQYGAFFDQQLYLFESDESRRQFKKNPLRYTRTQHVLQIDLINGIRKR